MNRKKRISEILKKKLENFEFEVNDNSFLHKGHNNFDGKGETHIQIVLINKTNIKCNRLDIHRKINNIYLLVISLTKSSHSLPALFLVIISFLS